MIYELVEGALESRDQVWDWIGRINKLFLAAWNRWTKKYKVDRLVGLLKLLYSGGPKTGKLQGFKTIIGIKYICLFLKSLQCSNMMAKEWISSISYMWCITNFFTLFIIILVKCLLIQTAPLWNPPRTAVSRR